LVCKRSFKIDQLAFLPTFILQTSTFYTPSKVSSLSLHVPETGFLILAVSFVKPKC